MSVPAEVEAEWNGWYNGEYIPGYRKVPGVIYARRYRVHEGTSRYTTVYEFTGTAVPESAEWKEQNLHSSPRSPRMRRGRPASIQGSISDEAADPECLLFGRYRAETRTTSRRAETANQ